MRPIWAAPLMVDASSRRRRPLPPVAFLLRMGPALPALELALVDTGDSSVGVGRGDESRFKLLTRLPSEDVREIGGARAKETVFCRIRESGRLSIDVVVADCGAEVPLLAEDMPLMRSSVVLSFVAAPLITKPASVANTGLAGCELYMEAGGVTN